MKTTKAISLLPLVAVLLCGCSDMRYSEYTKPNWDLPVSPGTMADTGYAVPLYRGWPEKSYQVLGMVRMRDPNAGWNDGDFKAAVKMAKKHGAEAAILRRGEEMGVSVIAGAAADPWVMAGSQTTVLGIRWRSENELAATASAREKSMTEIMAQVPGATGNPELVRLAGECIRAQSIDPISPQGQQKVIELLSEIIQQPKTVFAGKWLFRGSVKWSSITSTYTEPVVGIASCNESGTSLTMISEGGKYQVNFSGVVKGGRISGLLGFSAGTKIASAKCEGAAQASRIVLTGHSQTPDGDFQAAITFLR